MKHYDLIVIGGGPVGLSTAYQASLRGLKTLVLEQYGFLNNKGCSASAAQQFRLQHTQREITELALASQDYWSNLQRYSQKTLLNRSGSLWFGDPHMTPQEGGIKATEDIMDSLKIPYKSLTAAAIETQYSFKNLPSDYRGFIQPDGGIINLEATQETLYNQALESGLVDLIAWQPVSAIDASVPHDIHITTANANFRCTQLAITTGAYANQTMALLNLEAPINIWQVSCAYFKKSEARLHLPTWHVLQKPQDNALFYGLPETEWSHPGYLRVTSNFPDHGIIDNPTQKHPSPSEKSLALASTWVHKHMHGLQSTPHFSSTCLMAQAADNTKELLLDYLPENHPNHNNIVVYSAGRAGNLIPILGDMICQMLSHPTKNFHYRDYCIPRSNFAIEWQPTLELEQQNHN